MASDISSCGAAVGGDISDMGVLDLRSAKTAEDLAHIRSISDVGVVLIPEHLAGALAGVNISDVGAVVPVPQGANVNCMVGEVTLSAENLENGDPEATLMVAGQAFIIGDVTKVGYKEIRVVGQLFASRPSQAAISSKLTQLNGQNFFLPSNPRVMKGDSTISREFLELLPEPVPLVVMGCLRFKPDVTREAIQAKITEIVLMGEIKAPESLIAIIEVLTKEKMGQISVID